MARMMSKFAGLGGPSKEDRLQAAANLQIKLGNTQRYCELMVELGNVSFFVIILYDTCVVQLIGNL